MKYLTKDASLHGTGIRDTYNGGYIDAQDLNLSQEVIDKIAKWLLKYEEEHYNGYSNEEIVDELDREGKEIALLIKNELKDIKIEYFSDARMIKENV
jgi:hypothetical protein